MYNSSDLLVAGIYVGLAAAAFAAPLAAVNYLIPARRLRSRLRDPKHRRHFSILLILTCAFAGVLAAWAYCSWMSGDNSRAEYFNVRALEIYSGSSPAVPILILLGLFFRRSVALPALQSRSAQRAVSAAGAAGAQGH